MAKAIAQEPIRSNCATATDAIVLAHTMG